ncbi:ATP synthase subunit I [Pseudomaricurvus sp.]|uniref:ATP synthase subunit I n=1 Tax=Pseudomaricurvus sp. TaxID=2004510 RepID=UPI003F6B1EB6
MANIKRPPIYRVTAIQSLVLLLISGGWSFIDTIVAWSILAGGVIAVIPHLYFTVYAFRHMGARASREIARSFHRGLAGKFVLTLAGFASVFLVFPAKPLAVFSGYITMLFLQWFLVARVVSRRL